MDSSEILRIAAIISAEIIPIERHPKFKTDKPEAFQKDIYVEPEDPYFKFKPVQAPSPELQQFMSKEYEYNSTQLEVIDHLQQLADALARGWIGFEWYEKLSKRELARI